MFDLHDLENQLNEIAKLIHESKVIHLMAPADIEGVLALAKWNRLYWIIHKITEEFYLQKSMLVTFNERKF